MFLFVVAIIVASRVVVVMSIGDFGVHGFCCCYGVGNMSCRRSLQSVGFRSLGTQCCIWGSSIEVLVCRPGLLLGIEGSEVLSTVQVPQGMY